mmetsp:Transcript_5746/g.13751  ORF Transcript_5746/g.13751 Transcript_5746/m.13751 type:complete len:658 (+) Transcript_5746:137-2110(+)
MTSSSSFGSQDQNHLPHILLLITDQFRYDAFGSTTTPNLYKLFTATTTRKNKHSATTLFSNAYSSTPTCTPARAAILTGKSPWNHGMLGYNNAVNCEDYATTLPSVLRDLLGYHTAMVGKNHFGTKPSNDAKQRRFIDHGYQSMELYDGLTEIPDNYDEYFDRMHPGEDPMATCNLEWNDWKACPYKYEEHLHPTAWTTREALKVLDEELAANQSNSSNQHRPLFLKVSYHRPHSPYDPPKRLWDKHQQRSTNTSDSIYARNLGTDPASWDREYLNFTAMSHNDWHGDPGEKASRVTRAAYLANVEFVDEGVGKILKRWNHLHGESAFVVWISDHGDMNGDHNLWRKGYPWEASSHVNMAMKLPAETEATKIAGDQQETATVDSMRSDAIVEIRDVAPTIYDLLGILDNVTNADPLINGKSLLPLLQRHSKSVRNHIDLEHSTLYDDRIHWNAIVGRIPENESPNNNCALYKYIFFAGTGTEQLFCLSKDPLEQQDMVSNPEYEEILSLWRNTMAKDFEEEGRGENWVTSNGTLAIRTRGTTLGPNYPCHNKPPAEPLWKQVETRDDSFLQQHMMNSEKAILRETTERSLNIETPNMKEKDEIDSPQAMDLSFDSPFAEYKIEIGIVFSVTTLFLSILVVRYCCWFKRKARQSKKNF